MSKLARDNRNRDITVIQIARRQLKLTDPQYYGMLMDHAGVDSSKDLDAAGRARVLAHLTKIGFKPQREPAAKRPRRPDPAADRKPLVRRIVAQLISLDHKPHEYADGIAKQMLGDQAPQFFEWCDVRDLYKISQALNVEQIRKGVPTR
jgi:phage gp16-like protein